MMTITLGRWRMAGLAASVFALAVLCVALGFVLAVTVMGGPAVVASGPASGSAPTAAGEPARPARAPAAGGLLGNARSQVAGSYEGRRAIVGLGDSVGDSVSDSTGMVIDPVTQGAMGAAERFLPSWMSVHVTDAIDRVSFQTHERLSYGAEDLAQEMAENAISGSGDGGSDDAGDDVASPPSAAGQGRAPLSGRGAVPAAYASQAGAGYGTGALPSRRYTIELGRFATAFNAEAFAAAAERRGIPCTVDFDPEAAKSAAYAVRSGQFAVAVEASSALDAMTRSSGISGTVVPLADSGGRAAP